MVFRPARRSKPRSTPVRRPASPSPAELVANQITALVGTTTSNLTVTIGADGRATVTLDPALLAKLGIKD